MLKKTLLKNTKEYLKKNLSENLFLLKKFDKKQRKLLLTKGRILKKKFFKFKQKNLKLFYINHNILSEKFYEKSHNSNKAFLTEKYNNFLVSMHMIKSYFEKKQTRNSDFKNKLKEKKKLSILYGNLSNKQIKKTLKQACKLRGNTANNLLILLESRLDVILYRALFFQSIKCARQWINYNKILVNSRYINVASYKTNFGDIISVSPKNKKFIANRILKFLLDYDLYDKKSVIKQSKYKQNILFSNLKKKIIFKLLKNNEKYKKKFTFLLTKNNIENNVKLNTNISKNLDVSQTRISFFIKNLTKVLPILKNINVIYKIKTKNKVKNSFAEKHRYIISNFYFTLLLNIIKPVNKFLLKQNINKLAKIFQINNFALFTKKYKTLNRNIISIPAVIESKTISKTFTHAKNSINLLKMHSLIYTKKLNTKAETFLSNINKKIIIQTKEIINLLLSNNFICNMEKKYSINNLLNLNLQRSGNYYDILFFLKLKIFFLKNYEISRNENFQRKLNYKPLNLEISYKTLTIINLYCSQKIVFPCSLDVEVLLKNHI